jgi:hypothetical protein
MSTHYFVDPFSSAHSIIDVRQAPLGESVTTGSLVIRVPDGVAIHGHPSDLSELLDAKAAGILGSFVGFTAIASDDCLDGSAISSETSSNLIYPGGLASVCILGLGILTTQNQALGFTPSQCAVVWETFTFVNDDDKTGRFSRTYQETPPDDSITCDISFNAGVTFNTTTSGAPLNIPLADRGTTAILRFTNTNSDRVYFGGWSLVY